jgi:hypothetical protein
MRSSFDEKRGIPISRFTEMVHGMAGGAILKRVDLGTM